MIEIDNSELDEQTQQTYDYICSFALQWGNDIDYVVENFTKDKNAFRRGIVTAFGNYTKSGAFFADAIFGVVEDIDKWLRKYGVIPADGK